MVSACVPALSSTLLTHGHGHGGCAPITRLLLASLWSSLTRNGAEDGPRAPCSCSTGCSRGRVAALPAAALLALPSNAALPELLELATPPSKSPGLKWPAGGGLRRRRLELLAAVVALLAPHGGSPRADAFPLLMEGS